MKKKFFYETNIGQIGIEENGRAITNIYFSKEADSPTDDLKETDLLKEAKAQLDEYFAGKRKSFDLPLAPDGTAFQHRVWRALQEIPYGETRSYGEIARAIGSDKAARAVGMANNRNPIPIIIPCHRVVGANGKLVGYGGGLEIKAQLLDLEKQDE